MRGRVGSHPGAELLLPVGLAAGSRAPSGGRKQRVEASGQAGASGRSKHEQRRQREEAQHDERRGAAVGQQRSARGAGRRVDLRTGRMVRRDGGGVSVPGRGARSGRAPREVGGVRGLGLTVGQTFPSRGWEMGDPCGK